jgi:crossover junction endodeoxyribonuclease RuvC
MTLLSEQRATSNRSSSRIILGIDPGLALVGYALIVEREGALTSLACDVIRTPANTRFPERLQMIYEQLTVLLATYHPDEAAVESLFFGLNKKTAMAVSQARGVTMLALANEGVCIAEYTPSQVKLAVTGYGNAKKEQVGEMVRVILALPAVPDPDDAADAAAVAICHAHSSVLRSLMPSLERQTCS